MKNILTLVWEPYAEYGRAFKSDHTLAALKSAVPLNMRFANDRIQSKFLRHAGPEARRFTTMVKKALKGLHKAKSVQSQFVLGPTHFVISGDPAVWPKIEEVLVEALKEAYGFDEVVIHKSK